MPHSSRLFRACSSLLFATTVVAISAASGHCQEFARLPALSNMASPTEEIAPGAMPSTNYGAAQGLYPPPPAYTAEPSNGPGLPLAGSIPSAGPPCLGPPPTQGQMAMGFGPNSAMPWTWQWLPDGLMYRSYLAGVKEPRFASVWTGDLGTGANPKTIWDVSLGGRVGIVRYGTQNAHRPEGFQIDIAGAALPRLDPVATSTPLVATDYVFGIPITYATGNWQFKTGYMHLSSHLGDEWMQLNPAINRINYVRDEVMLGVGYFVTDALRLCFEFDYAVGTGGGSEPVQLQYAIDFSPAVPGGAPFAALYANQRQELNFGGYFVAQAGWQWRGGMALHTMRIGLEYVNGFNTQYEFFNQSQQRVGVGIWYDY